MKQIPLCGKWGVDLYALVDDEDYEKVASLKWFMGNHGRPYAVICRKKTKGIQKQTNVLMHRYILNPPNDMQVDHINCNPLDNRRINLRLATHHQNQFNRKPRNASGRKGLTWHKGANKWMVQIRKDGINYYLGLFVDIDEASKVYEAAAKEMFGEFAYVSQ